MSLYAYKCCVVDAFRCHTEDTPNYMLFLLMSELNFSQRLYYDIIKCVIIFSFLSLVFSNRFAAGGRWQLEINIFIFKLHYFLLRYYSPETASLQGESQESKAPIKMPIKCLFYKFLSWCRRQFSMETYCIIT